MQSIRDIARSALCLATNSLTGTVLEHSKSDMLTWEDFVRLMLPLMVNWSVVNIACKGAAVVAGVLGGVLALVGEEWVYMASALAGVAVIPILLLAVPKGSVISKHSDRASLLIFALHDWASKLCGVHLLP